MTTWAIEVDGVPVPQGSFVAVLSKNNGAQMGRPFAKPANEAKLKPWRKHVARCARSSPDRPEEPLDIPVVCHIDW